MCDEKKAINNLFSFLRGEAYSKPHKIYEHGINGDELVGFAAFMEGTLTFFRIGENESIHCDGFVPYPAMGARGIAYHGGGDYAVAM